MDKHNSLWQFKSHDLDEKALLGRIESTAKGLTDMDEKPLRGTTRSTGPGRPGFDYFRPANSGAASKVLFVFVPEDQARMTVSPRFIAEIRRISEAARVVTIVRPTPGFKSSRR